MAEPLTLNQAFVAAASALRHGGIDTPELDARLLLCHAASLSHEAYIARAREALQPAAAARLDAAIGRRLEHEPVARILGSRLLQKTDRVVERRADVVAPGTRDQQRARRIAVVVAGITGMLGFPLRDFNGEVLHTAHNGEIGCR